MGGRPVHLVLAEEVGEAARAMLAIDPDATPEDLDRLEALYGEVVQVAAVSMSRSLGWRRPAGAASLPRGVVDE